MRTATATASVNGRAYKPFPEPIQMTINSSIRQGSVLYPGQKVWAHGKDGNVYAISVEKNAEPKLFLAPQFLNSEE